MNALFGYSIQMNEIKTERICTFSPRFSPSPKDAIGPRDTQHLSNPKYCLPHP